MIDSRRRLLVTAWLAWGCSLPVPAAAQQPRIRADTQQAFQQFDDAAVRLTRARAAMAALEAGERPKGSPREWSGVSEALEVATNALKVSEGLPLPDPGAYTASQDALRKCATRPAALARLERLTRNLQAAIQRGVEARALLRDRATAVRAAEDAVHALVRAGAKLPASPAAQEAFPWSWSEFEGAAAAALAANAAELRRLQDGLERNNAELRSRASTLGGWLATYADAKDCLLAGRWVGSRSQGGTIAGLTVNLIAAGSGWSGSANADGEEAAIRAVTVNGNAILVSVAGGKALQGTLSADGRVFKGTFSSMDGPGTFTLRKQ
jgi:hypothetical protein